MNPVANPEVKLRWMRTVGPALVLTIVSLVCVMLAWWLAPAGSRLALTLLVLAPAVMGIGLLARSRRTLDGARAALVRSREHDQAREDAVRTVRRDRDLLVSALDILPIGIAVYDRRDRPILQNRFLLELIPDLRHTDGDGPGHIDLLQLERQHGVMSDGTHASASDNGTPLTDDEVSSILLQYPGDRWIQAQALRNDQGMTVVARSDGVSATPGK